MMFLLILSAILALAIGVVLGMLGGGGAILTLPMLVYVLQVEPHAAIATSLVIVGVTSGAGTLLQMRSGNVRWSVGGIFGVAAMAGAYSGGRLARFVPETVLLVLFGAMMVTTAVAMMRVRAEAPGGVRSLRVGRALALGVVVGALSGLVGAGGGFLIVPALTLFGGLRMREAIGTSLLVIALQSFAGFAGHIGHVDLDWTLVLGLSAATLAGSVIGFFVGRRVPPAVLRAAFAWLVVVMGIFIFVKQLPLLVAGGATVLTLLAVLLVRRAKARTQPHQQPVTVMSGQGTSAP